MAQFLNVDQLMDQCKHKMKIYQLASVIKPSFFSFFKTYCNSFSEGKPSISFTKSQSNAFVGYLYVFENKEDLKDFINTTEKENPNFINHIKIRHVD